MTKPRKNSNALGAYAGFSLQPTRMAMLLLKADAGAVVSMELLDDIGVQNTSGTVLACQTKGGWDGNPVSDRSPELWKTFANWSRAVRYGELDPTRTVFELYVNRKKTGGWVTRLSQIMTKEEAFNIFLELRNFFWGVSPKFSKRGEISESVAPHFAEIFGPSADAFQSVLPRFQFTCALKNPAKDLHNEVSLNPIIEESAIQNLICHLHGWLKLEVDTQVSNGKAPTISKDDFIKEMRTFYKTLVPSATLPDFGQSPTSEDILRLMGLTFVRQLELINTNSQSRDHAMNCFFRSATTRTRWSEEGLIHDISLDDLEMSLEQAHRDYSTEVFSDTTRTDELLLGRILLGKCNQHSCRVGGSNAPDYFIAGCYHALANTMRLGWHPRYHDLMRLIAA